MLWKIMVFFLLVIIFALLLKIFYMRKAIREIKRGFSEKLYTDTNTPIMLSSHDKLVSSLANDINVELKELQKQKHRYIQGDKELKNAITNTPEMYLLDGVSVLVLITASVLVSGIVILKRNPKDILAEMS